MTNSQASVEPLASQAPESFWYDPALPFVESRRACQSRACYKSHQHPSFSIGAVDRGNSSFTGSAGGPVPLGRGALVFVPAQRVHACNPAAGTAWSYQMLHLDGNWLKAVRQEYRQHRSLHNEPVRVVKSAKAYQAFCQLNKLLFSTAQPQAKETALIEFIGDYDTGQGICIETPELSWRLVRQTQPALRYLQENPSANIALSELAALVGMSRYQLIRAFRAVTGMTPHAWQLNQRINLAREQMRSAHSIADLAHSLGFADQAHFQRVFKTHVGVSPGRFRA